MSEGLAFIIGLAIGIILSSCIWLVIVDDTWEDFKL